MHEGRPPQTPKAPLCTPLPPPPAAAAQLPPGLTALSGLVSLDLSNAFPDSELDLRPLSALTSLQELTCSWWGRRLGAGWECVVQEMLRCFSSPKE